MLKNATSLICFVLLVAPAGCSSDSGPGGTGGDGGSGTSLGLDAQTALPATGAAASALALSAELASTLGTVFAAVNLAPMAAPPAVTPKIDIPVAGDCPGGGEVRVDWDDRDGGGTVSGGDVITVELIDCVGAGFGSAPISGDLTSTIFAVGNSGLSITADATLALEIDSQTDVDGEFVARVDLARVGQIFLTLGDALDSDHLTSTEGGAEDLRLGCFEIGVGFEQVGSELRLMRITPYSAASLANLEGRLANGVYTVNDYTPRITSIGPSIAFDETGLPRSGELTLNSGDQSAEDDNRTSSCPSFGGAGDESFVTAMFTQGGCATLSGVDDKGDGFQLETNWEKLVSGDFTPGGGEGCGMGGPGATCEPPPTGASIVEIVDSDFADSDWDLEIVSTEGAIVSAPAMQETGVGVDGTAFRQMTHTIGDATNCAESCSLSVIHTNINPLLTYNPSTQGAIESINYQEAQRILVPAFNGAAVGWAFAVIQNGTRYNAIPETPSFTDTGWTNNALCNLTELDFGPEGGPHPDFSMAGGEITFAYIRSNTNTSEVAAIENVHGIDDFKVTIVQVPTL